MKKKYYKIDVDDLNNLDLYGIKRDYKRPLHVQNIFRLDDIYKIRYPLLMKRVTELQYLSFRTKENLVISDVEKKRFCIPSYFLVSENKPNGFFEYTEILTGISFLIPAEAVLGHINDSKTEIDENELLNLFSNAYIEKIGNLFYMTYDIEKKEVLKQDLVRKLTRTDK